MSVSPCSSLSRHTVIIYSFVYLCIHLFVRLYGLHTRYVIHCKVCNSEVLISAAR